MPELLGMLSTPMGKEQRMLKAVGMECAAFIGLAAGKQVGDLSFRCGKLTDAWPQVFREDAKRLASIMMDIQRESRWMPRHYR
jgi:hypothetical protein